MTRPTLPPPSSVFLSLTTKTWHSSNSLVTVRTIPLGFERFEWKKQRDVFICKAVHSSVASLPPSFFSVTFLILMNRIWDGRFQMAVFGGWKLKGNCETDAVWMLKDIGRRREGPQQIPVLSVCLKDWLNRLQLLAFFPQHSTFLSIDTLLEGTSSDLLYV